MSWWVNALFKADDSQPKTHFRECWQSQTLINAGMGQKKKKPEVDETLFLNFVTHTHTQSKKRGAKRVKRC